MSSCTLAALHDALHKQPEGAAESAEVEAWLARLPDERARAVMQRTLVLDAPLVAISLPSLGSCLVARALAEPSLRALTAAWIAELEGRGEPWVQALRAVPLPIGLVAQRTVPEVPAPQTLALPSGATLELYTTREPRYPHMAGSGPHPERLRWRWRPTKPEAAAGQAARAEATFVKDGWGPTSLVRTPGAAPIELPCPDEGSADARWSDDGSILFVHGTYDEYAGGFAKLLDPETLEVRLSIDTERPVSGVSVCDRPDRILLSTYGGLVLWTGGKVHALPMPGESGQLSPDGEYIATGHDAVQVWSVDELLASGRGADQPGFPTGFDPTGERLVSHRTLYHGHSGAVIEQLQPQFTEYLEGGPASPSFQCTERYIINLQNAMQMWSTETGERIARAAPTGGAKAEPDSFFPNKGSSLGMRFPHWYTLAYDVVGSTLAALRKDTSQVVLHALPPNGQMIELKVELKGLAVALDREGAKVAVAGDSALEVRARSGELLHRWSWTNAPKERPSRFRPDVHLLFSRDGARLACSVGDEPWRVWALSGERGDAVLAAGVSPTSLDDFALPALAGWTVQGSGSSLFTHLATGTRVAFPAPGNWVIHPADARIAANPQAHVLLR